MFLLWQLCEYMYSHAVGVHASCPIELSPPSVVVRYGDTVSVNCSTSESEFEGMGWEATVGGKELDMVSHVIWTVKSLTQWDISPSCFFNPSPASLLEQCVMKPKVVLYSKSCFCCTDQNNTLTVSNNPSLFPSSIPRKHQHQLQQWF